jgi:hypothetical protein
MLTPEIEKPWTELTAETIREVPATTGVFQIADEAGRVIDIDYAGALAVFGLREKLTEHLPGDGRTLLFRYEIHSVYLSRFAELLMVARADSGELPEAVVKRGVAPPGRLHPR